MDFGPFFLLATLEGLVQAAVLCLTALGLSLVFGVMRVVNVAHGEFFMLGAVMAWWVATWAGGHPALGFALALLLAPLLVGAIAWAGERLVLKRVSYDPEATIVATIGMLYIIQQTTLLTFGPDARAVNPPFYFRVEFPWFGYSGYKLCVIAAALVLLLATWFLIARTRLGLIMRATRFDRETAENFGIAVGQVYAMVFALGAALAAAGGGAGGAGPAGALPDGHRPTAPVLHRGHHRRTRQHPGNAGGGAPDRAERRHHLGVLFPHAGGK